MKGFTQICIWGNLLEYPAGEKNLLVYRGVQSLPQLSSFQIPVEDEMFSRSQAWIQDSMLRAETDQRLDLVPLLGVAQAHDLNVTGGHGFQACQHFSTEIIRKYQI